MIKHNYLAILVLIVIHMAVGFVWYGVLFSEIWSQAAFHKSVAEMQKSGNMSAMPYIINIVGIIFLCFFVSWLVQKLKVQSFLGGVFVGLYIAVGVVCPVVATHYAFLSISKKVMVLDSGMSGVLMLITGGVLAAWRRKAV